MSDKIGFNTTSVITNKEGCFVMITGPIHQEDITIRNICASNNRAPKYMKQKLMEGREK